MVLMIIANFMGLDIAPAVGAAAIAAVGALLLAGFRAAALVVSGAQARRREVYSEAYKAAMAWREMLYRVRRRADGDRAAHALVDRFHDLQEQLDYFEGWVASESASMAKSYCRLVAAIKMKTRGPLQAAWSENRRRLPSDGPLEGDKHPDLTAERDAFLKDVRSHLSFLLFPRIAVIWRNRSELSDS